MSNTSLSTNKLQFTNTSINEINSKLDILPIGFVYIQFPNQSAPGDILAGTWTDITSQYAGLFFRAEGGNANSFEGGTQAEGLPNITGRFSRYTYSKNYNEASEGAFYNFTPEGDNPEAFLDIITNTSDNTWWGRVDLDASHSSSIYGASSHVTPVNTSIRIWKRTA